MERRARILYTRRTLMISCNQSMHPRSRRPGNRVQAPTRHQEHGFGSCAKELIRKRPVP